MPYTKKLSETLYDSAWLRKAYVDENRNASQVALMIGCTSGAVLDALRRHGIPVKTNSEAVRLANHPGSHSPRPRKKFIETLHNLEWLTQKYEVEGLSASEIGALIGASPPAVFWAIDKAGLVHKLRAETKAGREPKPRLGRRIPDDEACRASLAQRARRATPHGPCVICGENAQDVNHKDRNWRNNGPENLERLCRKCHGTQHGLELKVMMDRLAQLGVSYIEVHDEARKLLLESRGTT